MNERSNKKRNAAFIIGIPALALAALLACGGLIYLFGNYRNVLLNSQKTHLRERCEQYFRLSRRLSADGKIDRFPGSLLRGGERIRCRK